jgi:hypothetical protein
MADPMTNSATAWELARVVCWGFYDGPETGLAVLADGRAFYFDAIGWSRSGLGRAYEFRELDATDAMACVELLETIEPAAGARVHTLMDGSPRWKALVRRVEIAETTATFVGSGTRWMDGLRIAAVDEPTLDRFRPRHGDTFMAVRRYIKKAANPSRG